MKRVAGVLAAVTVLLGSTGGARAELTKPERKEARALLGGTLYLRIDAPCETGRHPFGVYKAPIVEVSPDGVNTEGEVGFTASAFHAQSTYWGVGPNDTVQLDEIEFDGDTAEVELTGVGATDGKDTVLKFVNVRTLEDFRKAVDRAFARVPLQEEHSDWPPEVKKAIAERRIEKGMTKRQVFYVMGSPESTRQSEEDGKKVEVWSVRQNRGMEIGFWSLSTKTPSSGPPKTLRFVDGKLEDFEASTGGSGLSLDD